MLPRSLLWPDPADLPSTTSAGSSFSSQKTQRNSWSSPAWITAAPFWLDSQPPRPPLASCCSQNLIQDDGAGLQGRQQHYTRLPPSTDQTTHPRESTSLIYISWPAGTPSLRSNKARSAKSRLFSVLAPQWWNEVPTNVRTVESLSIFHKRLKTHLFRLHLDPA